MLKESMLKALNQQINAEAYSAYLYKSMQAYFLSINLPGFAQWMSIQTLEEMNHANIFYRFIAERGGRVKLAAIDAPKIEWASPLNIFEDTLAHEQHVTELINGLVDLAIKENDHASNNFLQWFVKEQVEEEANVDAILQKLRLTKGEGAGLFMIDQELGQRVFAMPTTMPI
jgi:ferritin